MMRAIGGVRVLLAVGLLSAATGWAAPAVAQATAACPDSAGTAACWQRQTRLGATPVVPSVGFTIDLVLTPRAIAALRRRGTRAVVAVSFHGAAIDENEGNIDDHTGELYLGGHEQSLPASGRVVIPESALDRSALSNLRGAMRVAVSVSTEDNDGTIAQPRCNRIAGPLSRIAGRTHRLSCDIAR